MTTLPSRDVSDTTKNPLSPNPEQCQKNDLRFTLHFQEWHIIHCLEVMGQEGHQTVGCSDDVTVGPEQEKA